MHGDGGKWSCLLQEQSEALVTCNLPEIIRPRGLNVMLDCDCLKVLYLILRLRHVRFNS